MKCPTSLIVLFLLVFTRSWAQDGNYSMGARSAGLSNSSTTLGDQWAIFNNIGGLSFHNKTSVFLAYKNKYNISEFSSVAAGFTKPIWIGTAGIGFFRFGDSLYNEHRVNLGFSNQFGIVGLGINFGYYQLHIEGSGTRKTIIIDFGGQARITNQLYFGAQVSNLSQSKISRFTEELIPIILKSGLSYRPHNNLMLNAEVEKELTNDTIFKVGIEYQLIKNVHIRTGFMTSPIAGSFGFGIVTGKILTDYAYSSNNYLGGIHDLSISYHFKN